MYKLSRQEFSYNNISYNNKNVIYRGVFRTLVYITTEAYSKPCQTSKMMRHIENPDIVRIACSIIFKDI